MVHLIAYHVYITQSICQNPPSMITMMPMRLMLLLAEVQIGQYVNLWKLLPVLILLLIWGRLLTWMDKDAIDAHLPRQLLNSIMIAGVMLGVLLFLLMPSYLVALSGF